MPSRPFPPSPSPIRPSFFTKARVLLLVLTISASVIIFLSLLYFLYHLWYSLLAQRSRTIPFDSTAPLKLQRFTYRELKLASNDFDDSNMIGKGGSGTVFKGVSKDGKLIAIKRLDALSLQTEREFQNELHILGGLRSPFLVTLLGYCVEKSKRILVYEYVPNHSLQESLFGDENVNLSWEMRYEIISDVARALEFLHIGCDPPVIHGDIKPSNVLLDSGFRARISDFGLSRIKVEGEFGVELFSQELSGTLVAETPSPADANEVDFALALQLQASPKISRISNKALNLSCYSYNSNVGSEIESNGVFTVNGKGKEVLSANVVEDDWNKFVPYEDEVVSSIDHSKELSLSHSGVDKEQWGRDWWWRQDGNDELCSKDYVKEWIGSQIGPSGDSSVPEKIGLENLSQVDKDDDDHETQLQELGFEGRSNRKKKNRKMLEWWKEEHLAEISKKGKKPRKGFKMPNFDFIIRFKKQKRFVKQDHDTPCDTNQTNREFSFRRGWKKRNNHSFGSDMFSGDLLSSTTSMRGTLCYVAPEYGGFGCLMEKADIYSLGVLILVIVSGRRPLHVLASPMKLEKANLISWCRQLAQSGNILELVDEKLKGEYSKEQARLCINLALTCLQKLPELRPDVGEVVKVLRGEMELPQLPIEFSPSPPSRQYSRSRRKQKANTSS